MTGEVSRDRRRAGRSRRPIGAAGAFALVALTALMALAGGGCSLWTRDNPNYCDATHGCGDGSTCDQQTHRCSGTGGTMGAGGRTGSGGVIGAGGSGGAAGASTATGGRGGANGLGGGTGATDGGGPDAPVVCAPACSGAKPICDNGVCRECGTSDECRTANAPGAVCGTTTMTRGKCVACDTDVDCPSAGTPACFDGVCVACSASKPCAGPTNPICNLSTHVCEQCTADPQCSDRAATPWCNGGLCVACKTHGHCATAAKPICEMNVCAACATNPQCLAREPARPACVMTAGAGMGTCVECTQHADCTTTTKPICVANACVACATDAQCVAKAGANPGVCMLHTDGHCATSAEVLYVKPTNGCDDTASGMGLETAPFCSPQNAVSASTATKNVIVIRPGMFAVAKWTYAGSGSLTVIGQEGATIGPGAGIGVAIASGDVYIRGLTVTGMGDAGISVSPGATVRLNRCVVTLNRGGLVVNDAGYEINNSVFASNTEALAPVTFGGVYLRSRAGRPAQFRNNTIYANGSVGLVCAGTEATSGLLVANNMVGQVANCAFDANAAFVGGATIDPRFDTAPGRSYRLTAASPECLDKIDTTTTSVPPDDLDGNPRPSPAGGRADCGAHELQK